MKIKILFLLILLTGTLFNGKADSCSVPLFQSELNKSSLNRETALDIRSRIETMKNQLEKNDEILPELIEETTAYTSQCRDSIGKALLHSMLAEMYQKYYQKNYYAINGRINIYGYQPRDIRVWPKNLFESQIRQELQASLQPAALLQHTPVSVLDTLLKTGNDSKELRPTVYDFLAFRAIAIQPDTAWYQDLLQFRRAEAATHPKALLLAELDYLKYQYTGQLLGAEAYQTALDRLYTVYQQAPYAAEVNIARMQLLIAQQYQGDAAARSAKADQLYQLCTESIRRYADYPRSNLFRNQLAQMEQPEMRAVTGFQVYPGEDLSLKIKYTNIQQVALTIYALNGDKREAVISEQQIVLPVINSYTEMDSTLRVRLTKPGQYAYELKSADDKIRLTDRFAVSRLAVLVKGQSRQNEIWITDLESGKPVKEAVVEYGRYNGNTNIFTVSGKVKTNQSGLALLDNTSDIEAVRPVHQADSFALPTLIYPYGSGMLSRSEKPDEVAFFTDRGIYRPGEVIYFKGIAYSDNPNDPHVVASRKYTVNLTDANRQIIASQEFTTDAFGSFHGEFHIPLFTLNGAFQLSTANGSTTVRVESYKRPTFRVVIHPVTQEVLFGNPIQIEGAATTFAGIPLQQGEVSWEILRRPFWIRSFPFNRAGLGLVASGTTRIEEGLFRIPFTPEKSEYNRQSCESYELIVTLTNEGGETQEARYYFSAGNAGIVLSVLPTQDKIEKNSESLRIQSFTLNGEAVQVKGNYELYQLSDLPESSDEMAVPVYTVGRLLGSGSFVSGELLPGQLLNRLAPGRYRLKATAADNADRQVETDKDFILYSKQDKKPPVFMHTWLIEEKTTCYPGEEARFTFGTSDKDAYVLYELYDAGLQCIKQEIIRFTNENKTFRIPFLENMGQAACAKFIFVKAGSVYTSEVMIKREYPDRKLQIRPETFRDKIRPGDSEVWKFRILNADSLPVEAEVLAGMYDLSLDVLSPFAWIFNPVRSFYMSAPQFNAGKSFASGYAYASETVKSLNVPVYRYDRLNWMDIFSIENRYTGMPRRGIGAVLTEARSAISGSDFTAELSGEAMDLTAEDANASPEETAPQNESALRTDFAATAFFYPALTTNSAGEVSFSFTAPESNTTWKLQLLAQTKALDYGVTSLEVITRKPLMITPYLPRFLREGDACTITAALFNQTETVQQGRAILELFDPETDQPVLCLSKSQQPFALSPDSQSVVSWSFTVPATTSGLIGCRFKAETETASDGEQVLVPVLSNQIAVTSAYPFSLFNTSEKQITLPDRKSAIPFRITLEMSANPVWYAVQALPVLTQPENQNAVSWFAAYYSNVLARYIAGSNPKIRRMIEVWKNQGGTANTLYSELQQNENLKQIVLQETPWVLAANNQTEQLQRLSQLFDTNRAQQLTNTALQQLLHLQAADGGWSWFNGLPANPEITCYLLQGFSRLTALNAIEYGESERLMIYKAIQYLDNWIGNRYAQLKNQTAQTENYQIPADLVYALYVRSHFRDIPESAEAREAIHFYTGRIAEDWQLLPFASKAQAAWLMWQNGERTTAQQMLDWFTKTATRSDEKGMYWANNRNQTSTFTTPTDIHCLLMALFHEAEPQSTRTDQLKIWLLNQKRTEAWPSVPATVNAIYALLLTGNDWLNADNQCTAVWNNETYSTTSGETGTGYLQTQLPVNEQIIRKKEPIVIRKTGDAPAWGAVYEQYFLPVTRVENTGNVLQIEKQLFLEQTEGTGRKLMPVTKERPLQTGDKVIVQLIIRNKQRMDYVCLKDLYAGCFEITDQLAGINYQDGLSYYKSPTDTSLNFFIEQLPEGTFVLEYPLYVSRTGEYAAGISTIQCLYAPEYIGYSEGGIVIVK